MVSARAPSRRDVERTTSRRARACAPPDASMLPELRLPQAPAPRGASFSPYVTRRSPPAPYARAERTAGSSAVPRAGRDAAVPRRYLHRHLVVTGKPEPYLRRHCLPAGEHRAGRPPLPPSRQARPSTSTPSRPTTSHPSLGPAKAQALAHCPAQRPPRRHPKPPRPSPLAAAARPRRRPLRPNFGHHRVLGEHVVEHHHLPGRMRPRSRRNPASRTAKLV
jgi:hypothetical protein